ncbi:MAG TPA: glycosyltransferase [Kofleriaceae bacterium]|nr:glycosyltransferase [Kofleriaceae bacterium]
MGTERHRVLLFIPHLDQGGAERQMLELMRRLPERFEPVLCVAEDTLHYRELLPAGEPRYTLGPLGPGALGRLVDVIREVEPHILHSYRDKANFWARLAALRAPVPVVLTSCRNRAMHPVHLAAEPWLSRRVSDRVLTNSEGVRRELVGLARVPADKIQVIHNFIDIERFRPPDHGERAAARRRWGLADGEVALLLPGRISLQKHQLGLALALWHLRRRGVLTDHVRVLLAGRERDRWVAAALPRWMSLLEVDRFVHRLGPVEDIVSLYHAADALVMPSLWEGLSNAVLEAHACGLPAVVSHAANVDGIVVEGTSGFEVPTLRHAPLADAIGKLLAVDDATRRRMGQAGRANVVARFSAGRVLQETVDLYDRMLAAKGLA